MTKVPAEKGGPIGLNMTVKPLTITQGTVERGKKKNIYICRKITDVGKN